VLQSVDADGQTRLSEVTTLQELKRKFGREGILLHARSGLLGSESRLLRLRSNRVLHRRACCAKLVGRT
jgi:hypothetical protein